MRWIKKVGVFALRVFKLVLIGLLRGVYWSCLKLVSWCKEAIGSKFLSLKKAKAPRRRRALPTEFKMQSQGGKSA